MRECGKYVGGGVMSFPCAVEEGHEGPCAPVELQNMVEIRRRWVRDNAAKKAAKQHYDSGLGQFQGEPRTAREGLHADPESVMDHPGAVSPCPFCGDEVINRQMNTHIRDTHPAHPAQLIRKPLTLDEEPAMRLREGDQPLPKINKLPYVQDMVIADIEARRELGIKRYGTALQPFNGRNALRDAYEEALDLCMYLRQVLVEQEARIEANQVPTEIAPVPAHLLERLRQAQAKTEARIGSHFSDSVTGDTGD